MFDELTESDLQPVGARKDQADDHGKKDPLAAYGDDKPGKTRRAPGSIPGGVIFLAVLNFLAAVAALVIGAIIITGAQFLGELAEQVPMLRASVTMLGLIIFCIGCFTAAVGVGLLIAKPWGWWLAITVYAYNLSSWVFTAAFGIANGDVVASVTQGAVGFGISLAILGYLYNEEIRAHYGVKTKAGIAAAITLGSTTVLALLIQVMLHVMSTGDAPQ
jgi:hypothetical protein